MIKKKYYIENKIYFNIFNLTNFLKHLKIKENIWHFQLDEKSIYLLQRCAHLHHLVFFFNLNGTTKSHITPHPLLNSPFCNISWMRDEGSKFGYVYGRGRTCFRLRNLKPSVRFSYTPLCLFLFFFVIGNENDAAPESLWYCLERT